MRITIKQKYSTKLQYKVKHHAGGSSHPYESPSGLASYASQLIVT